MRKGKSCLPINFASKQRFLCPVVMHFLQHALILSCPGSTGGLVKTRAQQINEFADL
jgi:hypothetical protein